MSEWRDEKPKSDYSVTSLIDEICVNRWMVEWKVVVSWALHIITIILLLFVLTSCGNPVGPERIPKEVLR